MENLPADLCGGVYEAEYVIEDIVGSGIRSQLESLNEAHRPVAAIRLVIWSDYWIMNVRESSYQEGSGDHHEDATIL